jgi:putative endopeptidase
LPRSASTRAPRKAPGFSEAYMDRHADPQKDFYRYAAGRWMRAHPLPRDKSWYGSFSELDEWNLLSLKKIAERCALDGKQSDPAGLVGRFYRSALDARARGNAGFRPIEDLWKKNSAIGSSDDILPLMRKLHSEGVRAGFNPYSKVDDRNSEVYAFFMWQGGLSLPDRDYYVKGSFAKTRAQYLAHMQNMFELKGMSTQEAKKNAASVLKVETRLAKASRSRTDLRDPVKNYNRAETADLEAKYPSLALASYLDEAGITANHVVIGQPEFFSSLNALVSKVGIEDWKSYLSWSVLNEAAPFLHKEAEDENFDFFRRKLVGQKEPEPKWKTAIRVIDRMIGEALGSLYVAEYFPEEARRRAAELVQNLSEVFEARLKTVAWMTESTRAEALEKFKRFRVKIGHPTKFRDYSSVRVEADDFAGNVRRAASFEFTRQVARVGGPVDRDEWFMTPPTVNAYYSAETNEIVFPAGILQPPFFDHRADDAVNYGGIGGVIGHEITHGYDDQGRQYDSKGNLRDWWTKEDEAAFNKRAGEVVAAYGAQLILPGLKLNGKLTLGENIADLGGVTIAYEALMRQSAKSGKGAKKVGGLTPEQRFFVSWGQIWRETISKQESRRLATIDPHSPGKFRGLLPATNHPAFDSAFPPEGSRVRAAAKIGVW